MTTLIRKQDTTEGCREVLACEFEGTTKSDWKRKKKFMLHGKVIRVFENEKSGKKASVLLDPEYFEVGPTVIEEEIVNSTTPRVFPKIYGLDRSGRVHFSLSSIDAGEVSFYCGPEMTNGNLDDHDHQGVIGTLEELFRGYDMELKAAECFHIIRSKMGQSAEDLARFVVQTIVDAGATHEKSISLHDCPGLDL